MTTAVMSPAEKDLLEMLHSWSKLPRFTPNMWTYIADHGEFFTPGPPCDPDMLGEPRYCFDNALDHIEAWWEGRYAIGYAVSGNIPGLPIEHAWVALDDGTALDVTWDIPGLAYRGVILDNLEFVAAAREAARSPLDFAISTGEIAWPYGEDG